MHDMENISQYNYTVEPFSEDYCGNLAWGNLGNMILRCASLHAGEHGFGYPQMIRIRHAWVLSRLVIEMESLPRSGEAFGIRTWVDCLYRQFTDRHFSIVRPDGTACGHATSIWALIDTETREPADLTQPADGGFTQALIPDRHSPIAPMGRIRLKTPHEVAEHQAAFTDLDINGHVNSIRYLELLLDRYSAQDMTRHPVRRIEMAYCAEAYDGDMLHIFADPAEAQSLSRQYEIRNAQGLPIARSKITQAD